ncbi:MAG: hypothetical protein H8E15_07000 [Planctomycetes bacterium]|nr:hypothetical protein [Planctomycetota bacterium]
MIGTLIVIAICAGLAGVGYFAPAILNSVFNLLDMGLGWMGPFLMVTLVSALTGVLFILAFPHVSAQGWIVAVKDRIKYNLLGIRIFQDDMPTVGKGVVGSMGWNLGYISLNILPMIVLAAPFMVIWFQLNALYAYKPAEVGQELQVVAEFREGIQAYEVEVAVPAGLELIQRGNTRNKVVLNVRATNDGTQDLVFKHQGQEVNKLVEVGTDTRRLARLRTSDPFGNFVAQKDPILFFGDDVLPASSFVKTITVPYANAPLGFMDGGEISIMLWFIVVSMVVGFGLKGVFGVEI